MQVHTGTPETTRGRRDARTTCRRCDSGWKTGNSNWRVAGFCTVACWRAAPLASMRWGDPRLLERDPAYASALAFDRWIAGDSFRRSVARIPLDVLLRWFEQEMATNPVREPRRNIFKKSSRPHQRFWPVT